MENGRHDTGKDSQRHLARQLDRVVPNGHLMCVSVRVEIVCVV